MGALTTGGLEGVVAGRTAICTAEVGFDWLFIDGDLLFQFRHADVALGLAVVKGHARSV